MTIELIHHLPESVATSPTSPWPPVPDWAGLELADTWPDRLDLKTWRGWRELWRAFGGRKRQAIKLPQDEYFNSLPKYLLQEFHNLPNGNYSRHISRGYITGFDRVMLGRMQGARAWIASQLAGAERVLDIGTAGGRTAAALQAAGAGQVWGLDPSPYLLKHAATAYPEINFVPGVAEQLPFADHSLEGISLCFVLHEIPPKYIRQALAECHRVLVPGGRIAIAEPSQAQLLPFRLRELRHRHGWARLYFRLLAKRVYEPFLSAWHKLDKPQLLAEAGFESVDTREFMPISGWSARVPAQNPG